MNYKVILLIPIILLIVCSGLLFLRATSDNLNLDIDKPWPTNPSYRGLEGVPGVLIVRVGSYGLAWTSIQPASYLGLNCRARGTFQHFAMQHPTIS